MDRFRSTSPDPALWTSKTPQTHLDIKMDKFLNRIIKKMKRSKPGSSSAGNGLCLYGTIKKMKRLLLRTYANLSWGVPCVRSLQFLQDPIEERSSSTWGAPSLRLLQFLNGSIKKIVHLGLRRSQAQNASNSSWFYSRNRPLELRSSLCQTVSFS